MQRSESVLVYAVTAVLAVILVVAVVFGNGDEVRAGAGGPEVAGGDLGERLGGLPGDFVDPEAAPKGSGDPGGSAGPSPSGDGAAAGPGGPDVGEAQPVVGEPQYQRPLGPLHATAGGNSVLAILGEFRLERQFDNELYRIHPVARGETFSELVERYTGDAGEAETVLKLNEGLDPQSLRVGQELLFPWVADDILLRAADARRPAVRNTIATPSVRRTSNPSPAAAGIGSTYEIQKGDSLWSIAAGRVGTGAADGYVREILAANPSIQDAGRIRAGDKIVLPVTQ